MTLYISIISTFAYFNSYCIKMNILHKIHVDTCKCNTFSVYVVLFKYTLSVIILACDNMVLSTLNLRNLQYCIRSCAENSGHTCGDAN